MNGRPDFFLAGARPRAVRWAVRSIPNRDRTLFTAGKEMGQRDRLRHHEARTQDKD